jgi:hypothetical protein
MTDAEHSGSLALAKIKRVSTILSVETSANILTLFYKWPDNAYPGIATGDKINATAALKALERPTRIAAGTPEDAYTKGIVSIPWTAAHHGIRHWHDIAAKKWRVEYVRDAFKDQQKRGEPGLRSLICAQIPGQSYVLCLDSKWAHEFSPHRFRYDSVSG